MAELSPILRILIGADVPPNPNSGAAGTVYATTNALARLGHHVDSIWSDDLGRRIKHGNLHYLLELPNGYLRAVKQRLLEHDYDVVQLSQPHAWRAARYIRESKLNTIFVNRSHGLEPLADQACRNWCKEFPRQPSKPIPLQVASSVLERHLHSRFHMIIRYANGIIVPSSTDKAYLVNFLHAQPERVAVIHHGIPDRFLMVPQVGMGHDRLRRLLFVGQHSFFKGPMFVAKIMEESMRMHPEVECTWVTSRDAHEAVLKLIDPSFHDRLSVLDWMPQDDLIDLYDSHGIFVGHSLYEGAFKACTDAMARGLVVVASAVGALNDHIQLGLNGYLVPVGDWRAAVEHITHALGSMSSARMVSCEAAHSVASLSWNACATGAVSFYQYLRRIDL